MLLIWVKPAGGADPGATEFDRNQQGMVRIALGISGRSRGDRPMKARDAMVSPVITTKPSASVKEVAQLLLENHISAVPVVDAGKLVGIFSEGDLMRRADLGTERHRASWLAALFLASGHVGGRAEFR
jgi:predicted transcriptional regulator